MKPLFRLKLGAWAIHLGLSVLLLLPVVLAVFVLWYPSPFFQTQSAADALALLIAAVLIVGPLLTFTVYRPGKKGLKFDLVVISFLQIAALIFGAWTIHAERPRYVVFAVDRYEPLAARDVDFSAAGLEGFSGERTHGPVYVYAEMPTGEALQAFQDEVLFQGMPDLERRPEFWHPQADRRAAVMAASQPLSALAERRPGHAAALRERAVALGLDPDNARFVPVIGKRGVWVGFLEPDTGELIDVLAVDPFLRR